MADGRCLNADILASLLLGNNEAFAKEVVDLTNELNSIKAIYKDDKMIKNAEKQINLRLNWIVWARILYWDAWDVAKQTLLKKVRNKWWTIWEWARLLDMIDWISLQNLDEYAGLLFQKWDDIRTAQGAIDEFKESVSNYVAAESWLKDNYWIKLWSKNVSKEEKAQALWEWWKSELKKVKEWWTPTWIITPDEQWKHIERLSWIKQKERETLFNNYVLWRIFLWEDDDVVKAFVNVAKKFDNTMPKLTLANINRINSINTLINRVYTNALDLAKSKPLRDALKVRLIQLIQSKDWEIPAAGIRNAINVINTMMFADAWLSFSTTLKYSNVGEAVRQILVDDKWVSRVSPDTSNETIFKELKKLLEREKLSLWDARNPKQVEAFGTKLSGEELLKILYSASWDEEVKAAIELKWYVSDEIILDFAKAKLFGLDAKKWEKNIKDVIKKFTKPYDASQVSTIAFKATSWVPVNPSNANNIIYVNFNQADNALNLDIENQTLLSRARFNDSLADLYTLTITKDTIPSYDISEWVDSMSDDVLKNLEYIVIPNSNRANNFRLKELKERMENLWNKDYQIIFPRSRQSGQYFVDADWRLKFKTTDEKLFNEMSNKLAIESLNTSTVNLVENTEANRISEKLTNLQKKQALNDAALEFFREYMWTSAKWLSDEQVVTKLSNMTWVPINADWGMDWGLTQRVLFNNYTASGKYTKDIVTADQIVAIEDMIRNYSDDELISAVKQLWFTVNDNTARRNISVIREAYVNLRTTWDLTEYIWYKWVLNWLANKNVATDIWTTNFKNILASDNPKEQLAVYLYWDRQLSEAELKSIDDYLADIMDSYIAKLADNLTKNWYMMPMVNPRKAVMNYLKDKLSISDEFIQSFAYKNGLDEDYNVIKQIFDDNSPSEIEVEWLINEDTLIALRTENNGTLVRELKPEERFLPATYNSYTAVMDQMNIPREVLQQTTRETTRITADETKEILKRFFTDEELEWVSVNFYDDLIDWIWEWRYTSDWMRRALDFVRNPEEVTPYHESVHMYIDMFLTKEEKEKLFDEVYRKNKKAISKFITENWYKVEDTRQAAEEWIAENFIKFVKWQDVKLNKDTKNWFQRLWNTIKSWFNKVPEEKLDSLNQFYSDVYNRVRPNEAIVWEWNVNIYRRWDYWYIWNHWSPYSFEEFSTEFKWTWEWWDAHWAWIYIAARKWTAEKYAWYGWDRQWWFQNMTKDYLESTDESDFMEWIYDRELIRRNMATNVLDDMIYENKSFKEAIEEETEWVESSLRWASRDDLREILNKRLDALREFKEEDFKLWPETHHLYEVEIPAPKEANTPSWTNYLQEDWRYDMNVVNEIINKARKSKDWINDKWAMHYIEMWRTYWPWNMPAWRHIYLALENWFWNSTTKASNFLEWLWYDWIHYIWQNDWECWLVFNADNTYIVSHRSYRMAWTRWEIWNPSLTEDQIIKDILTKYENAVEQHIKNGTMTVKVAQDLKQQASYALNVASQDLILSRYGSLLSASDREWLLWMWFNLKLASNSSELQALKQANAQTIWNFKKRWWELAQQYNVTLNNTEELDKMLMDSWRVYTTRNWQQAIVDVWEELENSINSIPNTAWELTALKQMDINSIRALSPKKAYTLLKTIDLVKNNITRGNFYTQLMYQLNPQLRKVENGLNFFQTFKAVDTWGWVWVPWALTRNATAWYVEAGKSVSDASDLAYKANITKTIYDDYIKSWKELTQKDLENIVNKELSKTADAGYAQHYIDAFAPYVSLKWLSNEVKTYVNNLLNTEAKDIQALLKEVGADLDWVLDIAVTLDDGTVVKIWDMVNWNVDWWQQRLFWWLDKWSGERYFVSKERASTVKDEIKWAYAWYNDADLVTNNEASVITAILWNARKILQRDTNTNKFIEFDNAIGWQNDILKQLMEVHLFWWWKYWKNATWLQRQVNTISKVISTWVNYRWWFSPKRWSEIQWLYETYYSRSLADLKKLALPEDWVHQIALELAKYFKELESRLGSRNWALWVSMDTAVNRAFWNLWSIVRNIHSDNWVYSLMNKIGNNQVLWLFKFTNKGDLAYNEFLKNLSTNKLWWAPAAVLWSNYKEFVNWNMKEIARQFNTMFGSNFSTSDVNIILQWLGWYQVVNSKWARWVKATSNFISSFWWRTARVLMTYPYQLFTIYNQLFAYNVKSSAFKRALWVENVSDTNDIRKLYWVLEWTYVDFWWLTDTLKRWFNLVPDSAKNWILEIIWRDSPELKNVWLEFDDWIMGLYWKTTNYINHNYDVVKLSQLVDSVRDNANNIIDASQAQTFKWLAFLKALQKNNYINFMNANAFKEFMDNPEISQAIKDRLLDRVNIYSNRIFQDMLGTWFSWLDKAYGWNAVSDFLTQVLWLINFKGAWGTNIFRQTFEKLGSMLKVAIQYAKGNKATAEEMWAYIVRTPEFSNFSTCLWWDLVMTWRLGKYAKNGKLPDDESEVEMMDFVEWVSDNIDFISQQWQGLQSFWGMRPFSSAIKWMYKNADKWVLWALWAWNNAFWSTLASNVWRNWKPVTFITDALLIAQTDWAAAGWQYLEDNWHTLSAWTMRYMVEEWYNSYWANTALTVQRWWIPALLVWEQYANSDTAFMYDVKNWNTSWFELLSNAINTSQFFKAWKDIASMAVGWLYDALWSERPKWTKSTKWVYNLLTIQDDLKGSATFNEMYETGKPRPKTQKQLQKLLDAYMKPNYPGWYKAYNGLQNFIETWTVNGKGKDKGNYYDKWLEQFYAKIEERHPWELERYMKQYASKFLWDPNSEEGRVNFYNWARYYLEEMRDDPDYNLYTSAMYKWNLNNLYYEVLDKQAELETEFRKSMWYSKDQYKVSRTDINNLKDVKEAINRKFLEDHYDEMYAADMELMQNHFYQWIADELEPEVANWYFSKQPEKNREGNETGDDEWVLKNNIKNQIRDEIFFEKAVADWRWEDALTYSALMTQSLAYDDETWVIRASMVDYYADRIINSDWPATVKQSAFAWLIKNNEDAFTYDFWLVEKYWDFYEAAEEYKEDVLHNVSTDIIDNLNNLAIALHWDDDATTKTGSSWARVSADLSKLLWVLSSRPKSWKSYITSWSNDKFLAVPIKWLSAMGYKPAKKPANFNFEVIYKSKWYDPKTKTLWPITPPKKNKAIKGKSTRKMTQKEENELDLL